MIPLNPWELQTPAKALYSSCMEPICRKYEITRTGLDILLFLANNPVYNTAADIIEIRRLAKSHVSTSIKALEELGYLKKSVVPGNRRSICLSVCEKAAGLISDGQRAQEKFMSVMFAGIDEKDLQTLQTCFAHMQLNIKKYLEEVH